MAGQHVLVVIFLMAFIVFITRVLPFLFFRARELPPVLNYLERNIPPLIMLLLVFYCLKDVRWASAPFGLPELTATAIVIVTHMWRRNALLSIASGTAVYMFAIRIAVQL
jgi:branched-subunit amino acid transport protein AzlD